MNLLWMPVMKLNSQLSAGEQQSLVHLAIWEVILRVDKFKPLHQSSQTSVHGLLRESAPYK